MKAFRKVTTAVFMALALMLALALVPAVEVNATDLTSAASPVSLSMSVPEALSVSATPANISFTYSSSGGGTATASGPISVTTTYNLSSSRSLLYTLAYFNSTSALSVGTHQVGDPMVFASIDGGTAAGCNQPLPAALVTSGAVGPVSGSQYCPAVFNGTTALVSSLSGTSTDTILLSMQGLGTLVPGPYSGTLNIVAISN